ncbi:VPA1269 family protein [Rhizobium sp. BT04]|uniref:VPA1269 family protein n=1 Tax=Rhizobium sp. BT04 TaxID=3045157 RepID=UPI0024B3DBAB|nr:VPA1269 family protein [Rhizobium sp. BT04]
MPTPKVVHFNNGPTIIVKNERERDFIAEIVTNLTNLQPSFRSRLDRWEASAVSDFPILCIYAGTLVKHNAGGNVQLRLHDFVYGAKDSIPVQVAEHMLDNSELATDVLRIFDELEIPNEIFGKLEQSDNRTRYERFYRYHIAAMVMCISGATRFDDIGNHNISKWLSFYYNDDKLSFNRPDLFISNLEIHKKIFKVIAKALGRYFNDPDILGLGMVRRTEGSFAKNLLENPPEHLADLVRHWKQWRNSEAPLSKSPKGSLRYLADYLTLHKHTATDLSVFVRTKRKVSFLEFYKERRLQRGLEELSGGDEFPLIRRFSNYLDRQLASSGTVGLFPLISAEDDRTFNRQRKERGLAVKRHEARAMPLPYHYYQILREILEEGENGWPGRHPLCRAFIQGEDRYVPVLATLYLVLFDIPLRTVQVRRLCSGEGDPRTFNGETLAWGPNTGPHASYWENTERTDPYRGYARMTNNPRITGFHINTNKHSAAFVIPWQNVDLHRMLFELKVWQETSNPIKGPVQLEYDGDPEEGAKDTLPKIFPLFRMPAGRHATKINPLTYQQCSRFWLDLMLEVQTRWNATAAEEDRDEFVTMTKSGKQVQKSRYTSHGMRVAGITILLQAGLSIELVSRMFAGHATILQSIYYAKFEASFMSSSFDDLDVAGMVRARAELFRTAKEMDFDDASDRLIAGSPDLLKMALSAIGSWERRDLGICPYSGQRCLDGNPDGGIVEGGQGNCLLCKHHLTGPEYAHAVWSYGCHLLFRLGRMNRRVMALTEEIDKMQTELDAMDKSHDDFRVLYGKKRTTETTRNNVTLDQVPVSKTLAECVRLLAVFEEMERRGLGEDQGTSLITSPNSSLDHTEISEIRQALGLAENAEIYKSTYDPEVNQVVISFAQTAAVSCGYRPIAMPSRSPDQLDRAARYAVKKMLQDVTEQELIMLEAGAIEMNELLPDNVAEDIFVKGLQLERLDRSPRNGERQLEGARA